MGFAIALIPLLYLMRRAITRYLGAERAAAAPPLRLTEAPAPPS
jgi:hypothetical protein